jgi:hypothetical protein
MVTVSFNIYFEDLTKDAQNELLLAFNTTEKGENWDSQPLFIIEREVEDESIQVSG